jgi:cytochrome c2
MARDRSIPDTTRNNAQRLLKRGVNFQFTGLSICRYVRMKIGGASMKSKWITGVIVGSLIFSVVTAIFSQGGAADQGREVFAVQKCSLCHSIEGSGGDEALDGVGARLKPDDLRKRIRAPKDVKTGSEMKAYPNLTERDINSLIAYLQTLK